MKVVAIINNPAPYRVPIYDLLSQFSGVEFLAVYCSVREKARLWNPPAIEHEHLYLKANSMVFGEKTLFFDASVFGILRKISPDVVITTGFGQVMLLSWLYSIIHSKKHVCMTDGTMHSESSLSSLHRLLRKVVYRYSQAYVGASLKSYSLYRSYSIPSEKIFTSCLCVENSRYLRRSFNERSYDVMYSGQFIQRKAPFFFSDVVSAIAGALSRKLRVLVLGSGPLELDFIERLSKMPNVELNFAGFVQQDGLPLFYASAKLLLFPTISDPWGIVANEAMASGTPVITCEAAGVAGELVIDSETGRVLPLSVNSWANAALELIDDEGRWQTLSDQAYAKSHDFNKSIAAEGLYNACWFAVHGYTGPKLQAMDES